MTFDQIRYFIAVMESNTFFEAAEKLHITQSTLSKQIMKLEKELEVRLLDRSRRRASGSLSPQGRADTVPWHAPCPSSVPPDQ